MWWGGARRTGIVAAFLICAGDAHAQRATDNAVKAADDAFGTSVGNESTGLYNPFNARGFSPVNAGNVRIDGLYFDQQAQLNSRVGRGNTVRVGISAQSYAFPAPTGVADFSLRLPGSTTIASAAIRYGAWDYWSVEVDGQTPINEKLSIGGGAGFVRYDNPDASKNNEWNAGLLFKMAPSDNSEVSGFVGMLEDCHNEQNMRIIPGGAWEPPRRKRHTFYGQYWTVGDCRQSNGGVMARWNFGDDWGLRAGFFRSENIQHKSWGDFLRGVQPNGMGERYIFKEPRSAFTSYSGEVRLTKIIDAGDFRHTFDAAVRGRDVDRSFGGAHTIYMGPAHVADRVILPEPVFTYGPQTHNETKQGAVGLSYVAQWAQVGALSIGAQKVDYRRDTMTPGTAATRAQARPWLLNAAANVFVTPSLAVYASYTRGLEETGNAPDIALNRGEPMPAAITKQVDAGLRYTVRPGLNLVVGAFQVEKPYFNLDRANIYGPFGALRHRGLEMSLAGRLAEGLNVVAGLVAIEPRVTGDAVDRGLIGEIPVGTWPRISLVSLQYQPAAWNGFGVEGTFMDGGGQRTTSDNTFKTDGYRQLDLGVRYSFKMGDVPASFRFQVQNVTHRHDWEVSQAGAWFPRAGRRFTVNLAADF